MVEGLEGEDPDREYKDGQSEEDERARNPKAKGKGKGKGKRKRGKGCTEKTKPDEDPKKIKQTKEVDSSKKRSAMEALPSGSSSKKRKVLETKLRKSKLKQKVIRKAKGRKTRAKTARKLMMIANLKTKRPGCRFIFSCPVPLETSV